MSGLIIVISGILLAGLMIGLCSLIPDYFFFRSENGIKLSFKDFISYYRIAPQKWYFDETNIYYMSTYTNINLNFIDYIKFRLFVKSKRKAKKKEATTKMTIDFLESVQKDIDRLKAQSQKEQEDGAAIFTKIIHDYHGGWRIE